MLNVTKNTGFTNLAEGQMLAIADDMTGALEVGAKFAGEGMAVLVTPELSLQPLSVNPAMRSSGNSVQRSDPAACDAGCGVQILVIDAESRHLAPADAARRVYQLARAAHDRGIRYLYKKTDSTLRGNIGAELAAAMDAYPGVPLVYAPAYPKMGRTVKQGRLYVDGLPLGQSPFAADPLNPAVESHIPTALAAQCRLPAVSISVDALEAVKATAIYVCDGETDAELERAARIFIASKTFSLGAGPAGFAGEIARLVDLPREEPAPWPIIPNVLVINGSLHEISLQQVEHAAMNGLALVKPGAVSKGDLQPGWNILSHRCAAVEPSLKTARRAGRAVLDVLRRVELDALVVFGGDTAYAVIDAIGSPPVQPMGEVFPGVPLGRIAAAALRTRIGERARDLYLVTKAGGFGSVDVLTELRKLLMKAR